jgi:hypothetical protein
MLMSAGSPAKPDEAVNPTAAASCRIEWPASAAGLQLNGKALTDAHAASAGGALEMDFRIMKAMSLIIPFVLILGIYSACLRLSARLLHRSRIEWRHCIRFAAFVLMFTIAGRMLFNGIGMTTSLPFSVILGIGLQVLLGGWYFSSRGKTADGHPLGWHRAVGILALTLALFLAATLVLLVSFRALSLLASRHA